MLSSRGYGPAYVLLGGVVVLLLAGWLSRVVRRNGRMSWRRRFWLWSGGRFARCAARSWSAPRSSRLGLSGRW